MEVCTHAYTYPDAQAYLCIYLYTHGTSSPLLSRSKKFRCRYIKKTYTHTQAVYTPIVSATPPPAEPRPRPLNPKPPTPRTRRYKPIVTPSPYFGFRVTDKRREANPKPQSQPSRTLPCQGRLRGHSTLDPKPQTRPQSSTRP